MPQRVLIRGEAFKPPMTREGLEGFLALAGDEIPDDIVVEGQNHQT
jgi:hypothetical protein